MINTIKSISSLIWRHKIIVFLTVMYGAILNFCFPWSKFDISPFKELMRYYHYDRTIANIDTISWSIFSFIFIASTLLVYRSLVSGGGKQEFIVSLRQNRIKLLIAVPVVSIIFYIIKWILIILFNAITIFFNTSTDFYDLLSSSIVLFLSLLTYFLTGYTILSIIEPQKPRKAIGSVLRLIPSSKFICLILISFILTVLYVPLYHLERYYLEQFSLSEHEGSLFPFFDAIYTYKFSIWLRCIELIFISAACSIVLIYAALIAFRRNYSSEDKSGLDEAGLPLPDNTRAFYDAVAEKTAEEWYPNNVLLPSIKEFLSMFPNKPRILDLGCGPGYESMRLFNEGAEVVGIDFSKRNIEIAEQNCKSGWFERMDFFKLDDRFGTFDGIFASASLIHVPPEKLPELLKKVGKIINPDGYFLAIVRIGDGLVKEWSILEVEGQTYNRPFYGYLSENLITAFESNGYRFVKEGYLDDSLAQYGWKSYIFQKSNL